MRNNKGISLTEVIITLGVIGIIGSIAVVNYGSHRDPVEKRELLQSAKVFSMSVKNCILNYSSMGGWKIKKFSSQFTPAKPCPTGKQDPCHDGYPCRVRGKNNTSSLKKKLGYKCPSDYCDAKVDSDDKFSCLDIRKEAKGTKYQCIVHFNIEKQTDKIYCGTPATYETLSCGDSPSYTTVRESDQVKWPEPSNTPQSTTPNTPPGGADPGPGNINASD